MSTTTVRLVLDAIDEAEARRTLAKTAGPEDRWAADHPFDGDLAGIGAFLHAAERHGDQRPFGHYRITLRRTGLAIGGIGFKGAPRDGAVEVEVGYGLVPSARGNGYATEALAAVVELAATLGVVVVRADTDLDNRASKRVLEKAGFRHTRTGSTARYYEHRTRESGRID